MPKLTLDDLNKLKEKAQRATILREGGEFRAKVTVHMGTCGIAAGARSIMNTFLTEIAAKDIRDVRLTNSGCAGLCSQEPMITVELQGQAPVKYTNLSAAKAKEIFDKHIIGGQIVQDYALGIGSEKTDVSEGV